MKSDKDIVEELNAWIPMQMVPGGLYRLNQKDICWFSRRNSDSSDLDAYIEVPGGTWIMFLSPSQDTLTDWVEVLHNGYIYHTCALNFVQHLDEMSLLPEKWKEALEW